ncbi:tyrosine-type recombinase/integrase [Corynebacterium glutamicum]|uniref:tyrosine-type recombinase/integrase n=1 Tax=Corynebacterium glutamicum TaxID=1718 RepID=UPI0009B7F67B|nr:tyrosine-type recombinase/integrase [Corynebacterium glutamicum]
MPIFPIFNKDVEWHLEHFGGDPDALLFPSPTGKVIVETSFRSILDRAKTRAGYKDIVLTPHYGRVWMITTLAEAGMQIPEIGVILGQVDLRTITEVYMRASKDHRRKILGNVNGMLESKKPPQK